MQRYVKIQDIIHQTKTLNHPAEEPNQIYCTIFYICKALKMNHLPIQSLKTPRRRTKPNLLHNSFTYAKL